MRYAIISDLHANLQATEAVLQDIAAQKVDAIFCLGDAVGYGPQPAEVLSLVHAHAQVMLMGNHDAAAAGLIDAEDFSRGARLSLEGTKKKLNVQALQYLASLPYGHALPGFACTHSDFANPEAFDYIETPDDALRSFAARREALLFFGHTHEAVVFDLGPDGACERLPAVDFRVERGHRYLVNPGSVGMPRTEDFRATYCVYDEAQNVVTFHRTSYSVQTFRRLVEQDAGDSEQLSFVLGLLDSHALPLLHTRQDFAAAGESGTNPAAKSGGARRMVVPNQVVVPKRQPGRLTGTVETVRKPAASRWSPGLLVALVIGIGALAGVGVYLKNRADSRPVHRPANLWIPGEEKAPVKSAPAADTAVAGTTEDTPHTYTRYGLAAWLMLDGTSDKVDFKLVSQPYGSSSRRDVAKDHQAILAIPASSPVWQRADWIVTPSKDGCVDLIVAGRPTREQYHLWMLYDDISIRGATLRDGGFEGPDSASAWTGGLDPFVRDPGAAHAGNYHLKSGAQKFVKQALQIKAGQPLHITFWYRIGQ